MKELLDDVASGSFLPKRFRRISIDKWYEVEQNRHIKYLEKEIAQLEGKLNGKVSISDTGSRGTAQ